MNLNYHRSRQALKAGLKVIQLRCKGLEDNIFLSIAQKFKELAHLHNAIFIVNDRPDIALACGADGVHLGQDDVPVVCARAILGKDKIIGKSTHNFRQALHAQSERADYIGFGPIFKTQTKPALDAIGTKEIGLLIKNIKIPAFIIGGIDSNNINVLTALGISRVAVCRAILSKKNAAKAVKNLQKALS